MSFRGRGGGFRGRGGGDRGGKNINRFISFGKKISYRNLMNNFVWMNPLNMSLQTICNLLSIILM